jgi:hypothetical protein
MHTLRHRTRARAGVALLIALLLVPLALGGHRHDAGSLAGRTCGACVLAHHSPVVATPVPVALVPTVLRAPFTARPIVSCARGDRPVPIGRAPPPPPSLHTA